MNHENDCAQSGTWSTPALRCVASANRNRARIDFSDRFVSVLVGATRHCGRAIRVVFPTLPATRRLGAGLPRDRFSPSRRIARRCRHTPRQHQRRLGWGCVGLPSQRGHPQLCRRQHRAAAQRHRRDCGVRRSSPQRETRAAFRAPRSTRQREPVRTLHGFQQGHGDAAGGSRPDRSLRCVCRHPRPDPQPAPCLSGRLVFLRRRLPIEPLGDW